MMYYLKYDNIELTPFCLSDPGSMLEEPCDSIWFPVKDISRKSTYFITLKYYNGWTRKERIYVWANDYRRHRSIRKFCVDTLHTLPQLLSRATIFTYCRCQSTHSHVVRSMCEVFTQLHKSTDVARRMCYVFTELDRQTNWYGYVNQCRVYAVGQTRWCGKTSLLSVYGIRKKHWCG
jgi:hypothetical protein